MKIPQPPPPYFEIVKDVASNDPERLSKLIRLGPTDTRSRYLHWDKLRHLPTPDGLTSKEWWAGVKMARQQLYRAIPLLDKTGTPFQFASIDELWRQLHWVDQHLAGQIGTPEPIVNRSTRDTYLISSLIEEAIRSSQLEGASTTRSVAKDMLRKGRKPRDKSEQMIFNNYHAMQLIREMRDETLTPDFVLELHRVVTENTLDNPGDAGRFRKQNDNVNVVDNIHNEILHIPPKSCELPARLDRLCQFANEPDGEGTFIHPVVRSILLHFMLGYDHPFVDGNGRTARALFYWSMARNNYWLTEFISISRTLYAAPAKYGRAFLYTETDDNDATYFIFHQLDALKEGVTELFKYLERKAKEIREAEKFLSASAPLREKLNHRQVALLRHALEHSSATYRIEEHRRTHGVSYETARSDLMGMAELGILEKIKSGRAFVFVSPENLKEKIEDVAVISVQASEVQNSLFDAIK